MAISPKKQSELALLMSELGIAEKDLEERFVLGGGKGGQKVNKTANCVALYHLPSGIRVTCQQDRSREINRFLARRKLCEQFMNAKGIATKRDATIEKKRKQKKRRKRRSAASGD